MIYTLAAGDEPAAILELYRFATALGFEVVAAGKGKNNPLDITATPDALAAKAKARDMSARMLCEFVDGSKTAVEMCSVANATGLVPDVRGMHGAKATRDTLHQVFCPKSQGGVLDRRRAWWTSPSACIPGVFVVFTTDQPRLKHGLIQRDMGHGPNYLLFRPYHLCSIEVPLTARPGRDLRRILRASAAAARSPSASPSPRRTSRPARPSMPSASTATAARSTRSRARPARRTCCRWAWPRAACSSATCRAGQAIRYDDLEPRLPDTPLLPATAAASRTDAPDAPERRESAMHLIGLDVGTTGCKAIVFDAEGRMLGHGFREYGVVCDAPGQGRAGRRAGLVPDPGGRCAKRSRAAGVKDIAALERFGAGRRHHPGGPRLPRAAPGDPGDGLPVAAPRPGECEERFGAFELFQRTGMRPHPMNSLTKVLLLRELAPAVFERAWKIVTYADFILGKLGGEAVIDHTMASRTMAFDLAARAAGAERSCARLGLEASSCSRSRCPRARAVGTIRPELADELGLPASLQLVAGGHDQTCAALGAGVVREGLGRGLHRHGGGAVDRLRRAGADPADVRQLLSVLPAREGRDVLHLRAEPRRRHPAELVARPLRRRRGRRGRASRAATRMQLIDARMPRGTRRR